MWFPNKRNTTKSNLIRDTNWERHSLDVFFNRIWIFVIAMCCDPFVSDMWPILPWCVFMFPMSRVSLNWLLVLFCFVCCRSIDDDGPLFSCKSASSLIAPQASVDIQSNCESEFDGILPFRCSDSGAESGSDKLSKCRRKFRILKLLCVSLVWLYH